MQHEIERMGEFFSKISQYINHGYGRYIFREIPEGRDLKKMDDKLVKVYGVTSDRMKRCRSNKKGAAKIMYFRFGRKFVLLASEGGPNEQNREFFKGVNHRFSKRPLHYRGYSIGIKDNKANVMIVPERFLTIKNYGQSIALHNTEKVQAWFQGLTPFRFRGINKQKLRLLKDINKQRKKKGLTLIHPKSAKQCKT